VQHIVVAGHSLGGQMTQRYAMVGDQLNLRGSSTLSFAFVVLTSFQSRCRTGSVTRTRSAG
jgi:hypothetical protein